MNVAFFTLLERKILGYSQRRKGPNKVAFIGLLQPFADAIKLFTKERLFPLKTNKRLFFLSPVIAIFLALISWSLMPLSCSGLKWALSLFLLLALMGLNLYPLLIAGWSSNRKYATIGALRGVAQTVSYEISSALILLRFLLFSTKLSILGWIRGLKRTNPLILVWPLLPLLLISCVAETNRTPFDFAEGESELVSGFNIEYGAGGFALIFMAEYARILLLRFFSSLIITGRTSLNTISVFGIIIMGSWWVWLRATYPRYRYDILINLAWKTILPIALSYLLFIGYIII